MKKYIVVVLTAFLLLQVVTGCAGGGSKTYSSIHRMSGPAQITIFAVVPTGASKSEMVGWAKFIESIEGDGRRSVMINFYNGSRAPENLVGSYQGGEMLTTR